MPNISSKYQKDYKSAKFQNPRNLRKKKERNKFLIKALVFFSVILFISILYFLFLSPYFKIETININGLNNISKEKFEQIVSDYQSSRKLLLFSRTNILIFLEKDLENKIGKSYLLEDIEVIKHYPNQIDINILEKQAKITWLTQNQCFHLDEEGTVIEYCEDNNIDFIKLKDSGNHDLQIADQAVNQDQILYFIKLKELLSSQIDCVMFEFDKNKPQSITVVTDKSFYLLINKDINLSEQVSRLFVLLESDDFKQEIDEIKYIDLRFGEKIYYQ